MGAEETAGAGHEHPSSPQEAIQARLVTHRDVPSDALFSE
jgi:hypothetical protein